MLFLLPNELASHYCLQLNENIIINIKHYLNKKCRYIKDKITLFRENGDLHILAMTYLDSFRSA